MTNKLSDVGLVLLWLLLTSAGPFMFILIEGHPHQLLSTAVLFLMLFIMIHFEKVVVENKHILFILGIQASFYSFAALYHADFSYTAMSIRMIVIAFLFVFYVNFIGFIKTATSVLNVITGIGVLGIITFCGAAAGLLKPIGFFIKPNADLLYNYVLSFTNAVLIDFNGFQLIRISGYFEEPGALAFYITHALVINKLLYNSKRTEILLIIAGFLTFSLAFFLTMLIYYFFFYIKKKHILSLLLLVAILASSIFVLDYIKDTNPLVRTVYAITLDRFKSSSDDTFLIKGDNRSDSFRDGVKYFELEPLLGHGFNNVNTNFTDYNTASIFGSLVIDGIIGFVIMFMPVFYLCIIMLLKKDRRIKLYIAKLTFILLINYIQRPYVSEVLSYLFIILIIQLSEHLKPAVICTPSRMIALSNR